MAETNLTRGWDRHAIKAEIARRGSSLSKLAKLAGLGPTSMSWALWSRPHLKANQAIADFLGVPLHVLWPCWYDEDGKIISTKPIPRPTGQSSAWPSPPSMAPSEAA